MGHDQTAHQSRRDAPAGGPGVFDLARLVLKLDVLRLGEVLPKEVTGARLQRLAVLHHRFDGVGLDRPREALALGLLALYHGHGHDVLGEVGVDIVDQRGLFFGFVGRRVGGVALLPEELGGAKEQARTQLPADNVGPLVDQQGQITVALDPAGEGGADDGLTGRADD